MRRTIEEWKALLQSNRLTLDDVAIMMQDPRQGVKALAIRYQKQQASEAKERDRLAKMWHYEQALWQKGYPLIAGIDEAGRGPLAGPVVAAAVILPDHFDVTDLNDSKQVNVQEREKLRKRIEQHAVAIGIGMVDVVYIDEHNILQATYHAMRLAIKQLTPIPDYLLLDAVKLPQIPIPQQSLIKGDSLSHSIAAASIIAKTTRDEWMKQIHKKYPEYGFEQHMGYGVPAHLEALQKHGPCPIHRQSFAPVGAASKVHS